MSDPSSSDRPSELLRPGSLETMYAAQYANLVRTLTAIGGSPSLAADAAQDAFVQAYVHWNRISAYDDPVAWVRRVAINRLRNRLRKARRGLAAVSYLSRQPQSHALLPDPDLTKGIADLPPQQRAALVLHYFDGFTIRDVARSMGISEGTVKRYLFRARQTLRPVLEVSDA